MVPRLAAFLGVGSVLVMSLALGQPPAGPTLTKDGGTDVKTLTRAHKVELTTKAPIAPSPALRFELLPPARDRVSGNAALGYFKALAAQPAWPRDPAASRALANQHLKWDEAQPETLSASQLAEFLKAYRPMLRMADSAARFDQVDWHQGENQPLDPMDAALATAQGSRELTRYLTMRAKLELAQNRPQDTIRTIQTSFQLAKHYGEGGTTIHLLVGVANAHVAVGQVERLLNHPDAPNLYWALATLPRPLIDPRPALDGEARVNASFIPNLKELEAGPVAEERALQAYTDALRLLGGGQPGAGADDPPDKVARLGAAMGLAVQGPQAKKDLAARGWPEADLAAMPHAQAVLLRAVAIHQELWDDQVKLFYLPYPLVAESMTQLTQRAAAVRKAHPSDPLLSVFSLIYPAVSRVHAAHHRLERRLAQLRAVEAVRLHIATHGLPPRSLAEVKVVPVPDDPSTGKPFVYSLAGNSFSLVAPPPTGEAPNATNSIEYIVTTR